MSNFENEWSALWEGDDNDMAAEINNLSKSTQTQTKTETNTESATDYYSPLNDFGYMRDKCISERKAIKVASEREIAHFNSWTIETTAKMKPNPPDASGEIFKSAQTIDLPADPRHKLILRSSFKMEYKYLMQDIISELKECRKRENDLLIQERTNLKTVENIKKMFFKYLEEGRSIHGNDVQCSLLKREKLTKLLNIAIEGIEGMKTRIKENFCDNSPKIKISLEKYDQIESGQDRLVEILRQEDKDPVNRSSNFGLLEISTCVVLEDSYHAFESLSQTWFIENFKRLQDLQNQTNMLLQEAKMLRDKFGSLGRKSVRAARIKGQNNKIDVGKKSLME